MSAFNDFVNYDELLRSMQYKDIAQFCRTNSKFRSICDSARGKQIIAEVLDQSINNILDNLPLDMFQLLDRNLSRAIITSRPSELGSRERIHQLIDQYNNIQNEVVGQILMDKNYSRQFYRDLYQYFKTTRYADSEFHRGQIYRKETKYTQPINDLFNYLYLYGHTYPGPLIVQLIKERDPTADIGDYSHQVDLTFLRRHPELLEFFNNIKYKDYIDDDED